MSDNGDSTAVARKEPTGPGRGLFGYSGGG